MQIVTCSGEIIPLLGDFKPRIEDIAHALAQNNRYNGHTIKPYSVAQHSVLVSQHVPSYLAFQALMHDASECYTTDLPSPIKQVLDHIGDNAWSKFEGKISSIVMRHFGLPPKIDPIVKSADKKLFSNEIGSLFCDEAKSAFMKLGFTPTYDIMIVPLNVQQSYDLFLNRFFEIYNGTV